MITTTKLKGRLGNNFYQIATCIAYALRNGMKYYIPEVSPHMPNGVNLFKVNNTGSEPDYIDPVNERVKFDGNKGIGVYEPIETKRTNVCLNGYWQSFKYFDDYRDEVIKAINLPYKLIEGVVSIHVRRGDYVNLSAFDVLPITYYDKCIYHFNEICYDTFYVFSDDIAWCKEFFTKRYPHCHFQFIDDGTELTDITYMSCCEHNIVANSSFSFVAAWLNQNPDKIVLCPEEKYCWFNTDYIPDYFTKIC